MDQQIGGSLAGGIGTAGREGVALLRETFRYVAVHFVGGHLQEPLHFQAPRRFEQDTDPVEIGFDEGGRVEDGPVDMGFGREVDDRVDPAHRVVDRVPVPDIPVNEPEPVRTRAFVDIGQIAGVGQRIEHHDLRFRMVFQCVSNEVTADEPGSTGNQHGIHRKPGSSGFDPSIVRITALLPVSLVVLAGDFDPGNPLDLLVSIHARHDQANGRSMLGPQRLVVHLEGQHAALLHRLAHGYAALIFVRPVENDVPGLRVHARLFKQVAQPHADPPGSSLCAADATQDALLRDLRPLVQFVVSQCIWIRNGAFDLEPFLFDVDFRWKGDNGYGEEPAQGGQALFVLFNGDEQGAGYRMKRGKHGPAGNESGREGLQEMSPVHARDLSGSGWV